VEAIVIIRTILVAAALCATNSALAREPQTINQPSVYEQTMKFYLHPAHLSLASEAPHPMTQHPTVLVKQQGQIDNAAMAAILLHPAVATRMTVQTKLAQAPRD
jgi:hypothetical protein